MTIGEQIKKYRKEAGLTQKQLGEKLGISQQQIAQYENGKRVPKIDTINNIAGALNMGIRRLYPDFTMDEWRKSETYKNAKSTHDKRELLINLLSFIYGEFEEIEYNSRIPGSSYSKYYKAIINNNEYHLTIEQLDLILEYIEKMLPCILDIMIATRKDTE